VINALRDKQQQVAGFVGIFRDVTAAALANRTLMENEQRIRAIINSAREGIMLLDDTGRIQSVNPQVESIFGHPEAALLQHSLQDLVPDAVPVGADWSQRFESLTSAAETTNPPRECEGVHRLGHRIPLRVSFGRFQWQGRAMYTALISDISRRKREELELWQAKEAAEQASRAKTVFLSRISHELRTPLNAVLGFAQLLLNDRQSPLHPDHADGMSEILTAGRHLLSLIEEILDLSRIESGRLDLLMEPVDLEDILMECQGLMASLAVERQIRFSCCRDDTSCHHLLVMADRQRLRQVFLNLLSNAIKYNHPGGSIRLVCDTSVPGLARVHVIDTGPGLTPEQMSKLFLPFNRLGREREDNQGAGIGLVITRGLVEAMNGHLDVVSHPGAGCDFRVTVRRVNELSLTPPTASAPPPLAMRPPSPRPPLRVLHVEDTAASRKLIAGLLKSRPGTRLESVGSAEEALAWMERERPDVILLDLHLPGMDGFHLFRTLAQQDSTATIPVVAVTAEAMPGERQRALELGFSDYLVKPVELAVLLEILDGVNPSARSDPG
ncbi:MAG: response regulator, partial [Magnetococcus sp. WYHC-3]